MPTIRTGTSPKIERRLADGYHLYPPMDLGIICDGVSIQWSYNHDGLGVGNDWWPLMSQALFPGFLDYWNERVPTALQNYVPPMLAVDNVAGILQIWTGTLVRTRPEWSLLVRAPVNDIRRSLGYEVLEGIVAIDQYGAHLFANLKFIAADKPIMVMAHCSK
jgi:hypothetical protein